MASVASDRYPSCMASGERITRRVVRLAICTLAGIVLALSIVTVYAGDARTPSVPLSFSSVSESVRATAVVAVDVRIEKAHQV